MTRQKPGEQVLKHAIAALRKPEWLRDRLSQLDEGIRTYTHELDRLSIAAQNPSLDQQDVAASAAIHADEIDHMRHNLMAERSVLELGWAAYALQPERRQL